MRELTNWLSGTTDPRTFPYAAVLREFHRVGKHFVDPRLLELLDGARQRLAAPERTGSGAAPGLLDDFLDATLDKWDGRYDYRSYLALRLLRLPTGEDEPVATGGDDTTTRRDRDRLFVRLVADAVAFEVTAARGAADLFPLRRPAWAVVAKRCRLGTRAAAPALRRLGHPTWPDDTAPADAAAALHAVAATLDPPSDLSLRLSMLPVHVTHDEYLFIRVLQAYECLFAALVDELDATVAALADLRPTPAADRLAYARDLLDDAGPLFSLLATMQPESFQTFRQYTEGASAIQSRSYKRVESLCRTPLPGRLDSVAYLSVPEVRARVRAGRATIDEAYRAAVRDGRLDGPDRRMVVRRMEEFAAALLRWRRTHHRIATRMLGQRSGTGYTEGTPYLAAVRDVPVFTSVDRRPGPFEPVGGQRA